MTDNELYAIDLARLAKAHARELELHDQRAAAFAASAAAWRERNLKTEKERAHRAAEYETGALATRDNLIRRHTLAKRALAKQWGVFAEKPHWTLDLQSILGVLKRAHRAVSRRTIARGMDTRTHERAYPALLWCEMGIPLGDEIPGFRDRE